jgi:hypothetical protein
MPSGETSVAESLRTMQHLPPRWLLQDWDPGMVRNILLMYFMSLSFLSCDILRSFTANMFV